MCLKKYKDIMKISSFSSKSNKIDVNGSYLIMDMGAIDQNGYNISSKLTLSDKDLLSKGEIILVKDDIGGGNIIGKCCMIDQNDKYVCGDHVFKINLNEDIDKLYFCYYNNFINEKRYLQVMTGTSQKSITKGVLEKFTIPYIDMERQIKIGSFFKELDELIEMYEEYRKIITVCKHNYSSYFFQKASIKIRIQDLGNIKTGKTPSTKVHDNFGGTVLWATPKDLSSKYILQTERSLTKKGLSSGVEIPKDSVLVCCVGSFGKIGISQENMSCNQQINFIYDCNFDHEYIYYLIENYAKKIESFAQDGVVKILPLEQFKNIPITIHTDEDIKKLVPIMKLFDDLIDEITLLTKYYREFKKYYLNKIFK